MADLTESVEVGDEWVTLIHAASINGIVSWKEPFELDIFLTSADDDVPGGVGHRLNASQQVGRVVFPEGCIKARSVGGQTVIVAVTQS